MGEESSTSAHPPPRRRGEFLRFALPSALIAIALAAAGCGGDEQRQDEDEPSGEFAVEVASANFPTAQRLAETSDLRMEVRNSGEETIPDLAVTINTGEEQARGAFSTRSQQPGLSDPNRPVWVLEENYPKLVTADVDRRNLDAAPSAGSEAAQTNTFAFGPLPPGDSKDIVWRLTPVQPGTYTVRYEIAAGLYGKAKAVTEDGSPVEGEFVVTITDKPPRARVNDAGQVEIQGG